MRFWLIEIPAIIVTGLFWAYAIFLTAMTLICFVSVIVTLLTAL